MQNELLSIVKKTTQQVLTDFGGNSAVTSAAGTTAPSISLPSQQDQNVPQGKPLLEFLQTVFEQFRLIAAAHSFILQCFKRTAEKYHVDVQLYEMVDVWSKIQAVVQLLLTDYLDIQHSTGGQHQPPASFSDSSTDISSFFARKKPQRNPCLQDLSLNSNSFCRPCTLNTFLSDYVKEVFLGQHHQSVSAAVDTATKAPDAWRATTGPEMTRSLGVSRPLLMSTVTVEKCIRDLQNLTHSLPTYSEHFLGMMCSILRNYRDTCHIAYRSIVQPDSEDKRVFSAAWLKDEDINRFLKSLPNWTDLQAQKQQMTKLGLHQQGVANGEVLKNGPRGAMDGVSGRMANPSRSEEEESPEEVRQRNAREAEILAGNLGEGGINAHEIISDVGQLRMLAQLQESMEWFAGCLHLFIAGLPGQSKQQQTLSSPSSGSQTLESLPPILENTVRSLQQQARDFEDLADTCLLVLHLEVRVQCFHYLLPRSSGSSISVFGGMDSQEPDPKVLQLSRVLYVFEGLGHLIAKILIGSAQHAEHIDEMAIGKMCRNIFTLQQTLTNITMAREVALDYARRYYELFYQTPEEILNGVVDKGPQFSELEYMNAIQLLHKSKGDTGTANQHLERLSEILGEVGVTV
ncbi:hypothetical protein J437_LFUL004648 [Ladona fulva]|uniref:Exocyst complex component Sec8 n=1 Tax=Ladona fulva TaxID=123851 RepID=A0A8K0K258_LADFU|nr:hypothetical protein J437_LFUL004648 [Ladona fulva]